MLKKLDDFENKSIDDLILILADGNFDILSLLYDFANDLDTIWIVQAIAKIGMTGNSIKKFIFQSCKKDATTLKISLEMLASGAYHDSEISENLDRETPHPFFDEEIESIEMLNAIRNGLIPTDSELFKELCIRQRKNYIYKYGSPESGNPVLAPFTIGRGRAR